MAMQKKAKAPEPVGESAPMWIVSFADLVTLMMSFFVVLYAMKQGGAEKQLETTAAIKTQFGWKADPDSDAPLDIVGRRIQGIPDPVYDKHPGNASTPSQGADGSNANVTTIRSGKDIVTGGKLTFDAGQTVLSDDAKGNLSQIASKVRGLNNVLMVKGHVSADELPLLSDDPNGMALSFRRATAVADELNRLGIDRRVLRPVACGTFEPVKTGAYDPVSLRNNRRAEVFTTDYTASDYFPVVTVPPATSTASSQKTSH
jgi:chemotaxis protein MotB